MKYETKNYLVEITNEQVAQAFTLYKKTGLGLQKIYDIAYPFNGIRKNMKRLRMEAGV